MPEEKSTKRIEDLNFLQLVDPKILGLIPRRLLEQIEGLDRDQINELIMCAMRSMNLIKNEQGLLLLETNPLVYIAALRDAQQNIHGFLWVEFDTIEKLMYVQAASVSRTYQQNARKYIVDHLFNLPDLLETQKPVYEQCRHKIRMATARPKAYIRSGWKRSSLTIMEIENANSEPTDNGIDGSG